MDAPRFQRSGEFPPTPAEVWSLLRRYPVLIAATALLTSALTLVWVGGQSPQWTAGTTLLLKRDQDLREAAVSPLHAMLSEPDVASEVARLSSQGPARATVRPQSAARPFDPESAQLGLTTIVEDEAHRPLAALWRQLTGAGVGEGTLAARMVAEGPGVPRTVRVFFPEGGTVRVTLPEGWRDERPRSYRLEPGAELEYEGVALRLYPQGDVIGRSFLVTAHHEREMVRSVMERTTVEETEPETGVVRLTFRDSDPLRAARVANALVTNYLALHEEQQRELARTRLAQVESELERVRSDMQRAHDELLALQSETPLSVDAGESAKRLILNLTSRNVEYTGAQVELALIDDVIDSLERGDFAGLSKLGDGSLDGVTRGLIQEIGALQAQAQLGERKESAALQGALQERLIHLDEMLRALGAKIDALEWALEHLREQGLAGLATLNDSSAAPTHLDPASQALADSLGRLSTRRTELIAAGFLPDHPERVELDEAVAVGLEELTTVVSSRAEFLRGQERDLQAFLFHVSGELDKRTAMDRRRIDEALSRFLVQVRSNLANLRASLSVRVDSLGRDIALIEADLAKLPSSERRQLEPLQQVENGKARVAELLETRDTIRMRRAFVEPPAEVVDPAAPPARRDSPRLTFNLFLAALLGLVLGLTLAFAHDLTRGRLRDVDEVEHEVGLPVLAELPRLASALSADGLRAVLASLAQDADAAAASTFRVLRTNVDVLLAARRESNLLGVTSTVRREGRTLTAFGLAASLARSGRRVLLIPTGSSANRDRDGLYQVLTGERAIDEVTARATVPGLHLMPPGSSEASLADAFAIDADRARLDAVRAAYDYVLLDLPPLEDQARGLAMARHADALVLVCQREGPSRAAVRAALERLDRIGTPVLGAVFNTCRAGWTRRASLAVRVRRVLTRPARRRAA